MIFSTKHFIQIALLGLSIILANCKSTNQLLQTPLVDVVNRHVLDVMNIHGASLPSMLYDPTLKPFVGEFVGDAAYRGVIIPQKTQALLRQVKYVDKFSSTSNQDVVATCNRFLSTSPALGGLLTVRWMTIEVLRDKSKHFTQGKRPMLKELVYHELYHCFLNKGHLPPPYVGIMSPVLSRNDPEVLYNWKKLVDEMFSAKYLALTPNES